jgi:hypothetical protein
MKSLEIYFRDLKPEAQQRYLEAAGVSSADELNADLAPIAICDFAEPDDE